MIMYNKIEWKTENVQYSNANGVRRPWTAISFSKFVITLRMKLSKSIVALPVPTELLKLELRAVNDYFLKGKIYCIFPFLII